MTKDEHKTGPPKQEEFCNIGDYAIVGDCRSAALVSRYGSVDWLCWPCFDSPSIFGKLLDDQNGGHWQIRPTDEMTARRSYIEGTSVLETIFETEGGIVRLTDLMPIASERSEASRLTPDHELLRVIECISGSVNIKSVYDPRPQYGKSKSQLVDKKRLGVKQELGRSVLTLHSDLEWNLKSSGVASVKLLHAGDCIPLSLTHSSEAPCVLPDLKRVHEVIDENVRWWREWSGKCTYQGPFREAVLRSVLTLKLLQYGPSGAFVAAPTTSLPEKIGCELNWDYRYCWLRDASLAIQALHETGFRNEADCFANWMLHATRLTRPKLMVMYDVYGNIVAKEKVLKQWTGYRTSAPVHLGNKARKQFQLDTYGEVICGVAQVLKTKGNVDREAGKVLVGLGKYVCRHWKEPDDGIWEPRGAPKIHTHSRLLCWVALEHLLQLAEANLLQGVPVAEFERIRAEIRNDLETNSWDEDFESYTSEPGTQKLDATLLMLTLHNFEAASSQRSQKTYERIRDRLGAGGPLLYRNRGDGPPAEGAFGICSFWGVEFLAMGGGSLEEARDCFEHLLAYGNDVGLFAEEIDPGTGAALGNFPQAFTHIGLINAAIAIHKREMNADAGSTGHSAGVAK